MMLVVILGWQAIIPLSLSLPVIPLLVICHFNKLTNLVTDRTAAEDDWMRGAWDILIKWLLVRTLDFRDEITLAFMGKNRTFFTNHRRARFYQLNIKMQMQFFCDILVGVLLVGGALMWHYGEISPSTFITLVRLYNRAGRQLCVAAESLTIMARGLPALQRVANFLNTDLGLSPMLDSQAERSRQMAESAEHMAPDADLCPGIKAVEEEGSSLAVDVDAKRVEAVNRWSQALLGLARSGALGPLGQWTVEMKGVLATSRARSKALIDVANRLTVEDLISAIHLQDVGYHSSGQNSHPLLPSDDHWAFRGLTGSLRLGGFYLLRSHTAPLSTATVSNGTTLLKVIAGYITPSTGKVFFPSHLKAHLVQQETMFFDDTLWRNLLPLGEEHIGFSPEFIWSLMRRLGFSEQVIAEGGGFKVGPNGSNLKLVDRQLVTIARALLAGTEVLLLSKPGALMRPRHRVGLFRFLGLWVKLGLKAAVGHPIPPRRAGEDGIRSQNSIGSDPNICRIAESEIRHISSAGHESSSVPFHRLIGCGGVRTIICSLDSSMQMPSDEDLGFTPTNWNVDVNTEKSTTTKRSYSFGEVEMRAQMN